jgi:hypothetical protein
MILGALPGPRSLSFLKVCMYVVFGGKKLVFACLGWPVV